VQTHVRRRIAGVRRAATAVPLVEADDAVGLGVPGPRRPLRCARPRTAVDIQGRLAVRVAELFVVDAVAVSGVEKSTVVGTGRRVEINHSRRSYGMIVVEPGGPLPTCLFGRGVESGRGRDVAQGWSTRVIDKGGRHEG